jgi:hypothetical protein
MNAVIPEEIMGSDRRVFGPWFPAAENPLAFISTILPRIH